MSDSVRPHRWQPTRLLCHWDSPGKNTGVDCHFLLQCMKVKSESKVAQSCPTLSDPMDCSLPGSSVHGIFQARILEWGAIAFSEESPRIVIISIVKLVPFFQDNANFVRIIQCVHWNWVHTFTFVYSRVPVLESVAWKRLWNIYCSLPFFLSISIQFQKLAK